MTLTDLDEVLADRLTEAAATFEPPPGAVARILAGTGPTITPAPTPQRRVRLRLPRRPALAVGVAAVIVVGAVTGLGALVASSPRSPNGAVAAGGVRSAPKVPPPRGALPAVPTPLAAAGLVPPSRALGSVAAPSDSADIVETGTVALTVRRSAVTTTITQVETIAKEFGGYVSASNSQEAGPNPSGTVTFRVPVGNFEPAVAQIRRLGRVSTASLSAQDVTGQVVDLGAQISALQATRSTYLAILTRATTIGQVIAVQQQINSVQEQIQELQGQRKLLLDESAMSSVTVSVNTTTPVPPPQPGRENGFVRAFRSAAGSFVRGVEDIVAALGPILLVLLVVALIALAGWWGWRTVRRQLV
jgi:hypothetical protein